LAAISAIFWSEELDTDDRFERLELREYLLDEKVDRRFAIELHRLFP